MKFNSIVIVVFLVVFVSCKTMIKNDNYTSHFYSPNIAADFLIDSTAYLLIKPFRDSLNQSMNEVLVRSNHALEKGQPESKLGNFVADLCFSTGNNLFNSGYGASIDFCVLNNGGLRSSLPAGNITRKNVYELMPFDNELVVLELDGKTTYEVLEHIATKGGVPVANLRMKIIDNKPYDIFIGENKFNIGQTYYILTSDYLAFGGDAMEMFTNASNSINLGIKVRDAIIDYLAEMNSRKQFVNVETDGRISR